mmetsp:Transcript_13394/g.30031  ORF Transcript_13394/g.30031 Transcript_13394/m.30031 type:complete len:488 (-) Transcript_13394:1135-2598(-)
MLYHVGVPLLLSNVRRRPPSEVDTGQVGAVSVEQGNDLHVSAHSGHMQGGGPDLVGGVHICHALEEKINRGDVARHDSPEESGCAVWPASLKICSAIQHHLKNLAQAVLRCYDKRRTSTGFQVGGDARNMTQRVMERNKFQGCVPKPTTEQSKQRINIGEQLLHIVSLLRLLQQPTHHHPTHQVVLDCAMQKPVGIHASCVRKHGDNEGLVLQREIRHNLPALPLRLVKAVARTNHIVGKSVGLLQMAHDSHDLQDCQRALGSDFQRNLSDFQVLGQPHQHSVDIPFVKVQHSNLLPTVGLELGEHHEDKRGAILHHGQPGLEPLGELGDEVQAQTQLREDGQRAVRHVRDLQEYPWPPHKTGFGISSGACQHKNPMKLQRQRPDHIFHIRSLRSGILQAIEDENRPAAGNGLLDHGPPVVQLAVLVHEKTHNALIVPPRTTQKICKLLHRDVERHKLRLAPHKRHHHPPRQDRLSRSRLALYHVAR